VTVVTGIARGEPVGFTCQSFSSLSLDPPLVVLLPSLASTSWPRIAESGRFCVNVLAEHQEDLSSRFAWSGSEKFSGVAWTASSTGGPVLEGACASIDCEIEQVHPGGDHLVVIAAVIDLAADSARDPLLFHRGRYARPARAHEA
jgi:flavin reductase (DIM6/NTAB) family NADH-FMN oxidoreductase RutF